MEKTENLEIKQPKTTKQKVFFGLKIAGNVLFYLIIIFLFLISIAQINSGGKNGIPNIFGKGYLSVQSESMSGSVDAIGDEAVRELYKNYEFGQFSKGDLVIVDVLDEDDYDDLKVGDIITFWDDSINAYNTHRIVRLNKAEDGTIINLSAQGDRSVQINGLYKDPSVFPDASVEDNFKLEQGNHIQTFSESNLKLIKGKVTDIWYGKGTVLDHIQEYWEWYFVMPVLLLLLFEVFMVVKNIMDLKGAKNKALLAADKDAMMAELAAEKERMRQELLAELAAQRTVNESSLEASNEEDKIGEADEEVAEEIVAEAEEVQVEETTAEAEEAQTEEAAAEEVVEAPAEEAEVEVKEEVEEKIEE